MGQQAVALAKAVDYASAGTVEFIVDTKRNFYFREMNTRLQVEHPVTECITGLDLVEWMIRIAAGEKLTIAQKDVKLQGWAVEARVYAEDPARNFLPSIGRLTRYIAPGAMAGVRVDTGVYEGGEISMYYDPMIAKLVGFGKDRNEAIDRCAAALDAYCVRGVNHNIGFLSAIMAHPRFRAGRLSTGFIAEEFPDGFRGRDPGPELRTHLVAIAALLERRAAEVETGISGQLPGHEARVPDVFSVALNGAATLVAIKRDGENYALHLDDATVVVSSNWRPGSPIFSGLIGAEPIVAQVDRTGPRWRIVHAGCMIEARVVRAGVADLAALMPVKRSPDTSKFLLSPMPGLLKTVAVKAGQDGKAGEELCVVEAMKMENILRAERDGTVAKLHAAPGDSLAVDQRILEFS
jgi:propionyl-CoA carboxylase alpha chain